MNIGFLGLGKLGLPVALAVESKGHKVFGYDLSNKVIESIKKKKIDYKEVFVDKYLPNTKLEILDVDSLVDKSEIIFVPIQTPHEEKYEGIKRIPSERADFDYSYLINGIANLSKVIDKKNKEIVVIIISTVLPGTIRREIKPILSKKIKLCYNPFFIAMGSTINDFLSPEFVLFGVDDLNALKVGKKFYNSITKAPLFDTTLENAELIKVAYNTLISTKIAFSNTLMELCHKLDNTNIDDVIGALKLAKRRLISTAYMDGGMGDGGGCHPRDNIAMSYLSKKYNISYNWFEHIMKQRESQSDWLADVIISHSNGKKINILGKTFKAESNLTLGSPSLLLNNILLERGVKVNIWDPIIDGDFQKFVNLYNWDKKPQLFFVGTKHQEFQNFPFIKGSVVIDPWRYLTQKEGVKLIKVGNSIFNKKN